jgi:hypothetical protein
MTTHMLSRTSQENTAKELEEKRVRIQVSTCGNNTSLPLLPPPPPRPQYVTPHIVLESFLRKVSNILPEETASHPKEKSSFHIKLGKTCGFSYRFVQLILAIIQCHDIWRSRGRLSRLCPALLWYVKPCRLVDRCKRFDGFCCLHLQNTSIRHMVSHSPPRKLHIPRFHLCSNLTNLLRKFSKKIK